VRLLDEAKKITFNLTVKQLVSMLRGSRSLGVADGHVGKAIVTVFKESDAR
jgi:hypothetical protein